MNGAYYGALPASALVELLKIRAQSRAATGHEQQRQTATALWKRRNRRSDAAFKSIRERLLRPKKGRRGVCAWCDHDSASTIDHIAPKRHFPHLAFTWSNLVPCCGRCNPAKGDRAAVIVGSRKVDRTRKTPHPLPFGKLAIINPRRAQMEDFFELDLHTGEWLPAGSTRQADKRARYTLQVLKLNEVQLLKDARISAWKAIKNSLTLAAQAQSSGHQTEVLAHRAEVRAQPRTIWAQLKLQRGRYPAIARLFEALPQALHW